jgi:dihydropyrimidine dehydrogenase (NAD+) subunit PreT
MMGRGPGDRSESKFEEFKPAYTLAQARVEANRCIFCFDAPCVKSCPTSINVPQFIRRIAEDNVRGSARSIFEDNILGMSCARVCPVEVLCVGKCVLNDAGVAPIQIGRLQRFATDEAYEQGWKFFEAGPDSGKKVALIGGGPASLAAAHQLRRLGHGVDIVEKSQWLGGLNTSGIAPYKMKSDRSLEEAEWVLSIGGVGLELGVSVPDEVTWAELESKYDAIFLGMGLGSDTILPIDGTENEGVDGAVDLIERIKLGRVDLESVRSAIVLGGGNTAIDAARELKGLGVAEVIMAYRGIEAVKSGYQHEWSRAVHEGVLARWSCQPLEILAASGRVSAVRFQQLDEGKSPIAGREFTLPTDLVAFALGQQKLGSLVAELDGVQVERGRIVVDESGATGRPGLYAGGDCANGGKEVVNAAAEGKTAALNIHAYLES